MDLMIEKFERDIKDVITDYKNNALHLEDIENLKYTISYFNAAFLIDSDDDIDVNSDYFYNNNCIFIKKNYDDPDIIIVG